MTCSILKQSDRLCKLFQCHVQVKRYLEDNFRNREGRPIENEMKHFWLFENDIILTAEMVRAFQKLRLVNKKVSGHLTVVTSGSQWVSVGPRGYQWVLGFSHLGSSHPQLLSQPLELPALERTQRMNSLQKLNHWFKIKASFWNFILRSLIFNVELVLALPLARTDIYQFFLC